VLPAVWWFAKSVAAIDLRLRALPLEERHLSQLSTSPLRRVVSVFLSEKFGAGR
jgi:hypothetical protein